MVYLDVEVRRVFEGRLWDLPARVYSDRLVLFPGTPAGPAEIVRRLERSGFARVEGNPAAPGQYRRRGTRLDVWTRAFRGAGIEVPSRRARLRFDGSVVSEIDDGGGRPLRSLELEPELLALLTGPQKEEREIVSLGDVPRRLIQAILAAEDSRFYAHPGVDFLAVARAALENLRSARIVQGGSTITQQTVKNLYLGQERTWWRKLREAALSLVVDGRYSKDRILEVYLNEVYLGQRGPVAVCGVAAASRFYFGRDLPDLSLGESALLAGLIRNPGGNNPFVHPKEAIARRNQVLAAMRELGSIDAEDERRARGESLRLASGKEGFSRSPWIADFVRSQLADLYGDRAVAREGLRVFTTVDTLLQESAQDALVRGLARLDDRARGSRVSGAPLEGCIIVLEPDTGAVLAMVGGRDYRRSQFNRAIQARRQPGSSFKPFVFLAAFEEAVRGDERGLTPASMLDDEPLVLRRPGIVWEPKNYDGRFRGPVTVRTTLEESLNVPTVRAALATGLDEVVRTARRCGFSNLDRLPSLALGAQEVTPMELAAAYGVLAAQGLRAQPFIVREVESREGERLERRRLERIRVVSRQAAYLVTDVLRGVLEKGTAASARDLGFEGNAAGKTGTTDDTRDSWFVGYTPDVLVLVWVGRDDASRTGLTGASGALPIWADFMRRSGRTSWAPFPEPPGIARVSIDPASGGRAVGRCPSPIVEVFAEGTEPTDNCPLHESGLTRWLRKIFGGGRRGSR